MYVKNYIFCKTYFAKLSYIRESKEKELSGLISGILA